MLCKKCGFENIDGSKFCVKCGNDLSENEIETIDFINNNQVNTNQNVEISQSNQINSPEMINNEVNDLNNTVMENSSVSQNLNNMTSNMNNLQTNVELNESSSVQNSNVNSVSNERVSLFSAFIGILIKPMQTIHDKIKNFEIKHSIIATAVISLVIMVLNLIQTIIKTVRTTSYDYSTFSEKTEWNFDALKNLKFFDLVAKNYFYVVVAIAAVAGIYYIVSMIMKKDVKFQQVLGLKALSLIPLTISGLIVYPIIMNFSTVLAMFILLVGIFYSFIIFIFGMNELIEFKNSDEKIYYHLICISIVILIICIMASKITTSVSDYDKLF